MGYADKVRKWTVVDSMSLLAGPSLGRQRTTNGDQHQPETTSPQQVTGVT